MVFAARYDEEMEDSLVDPSEYYGTMLHSLRDEDQTALGQELFLILEPELYLTSKVKNLSRIRSEETQYLVVIVNMLRESAVRIGCLRPEPNGFRVRAPFYHPISQPHHDDLSVGCPGFSLNSGKSRPGAKLVTICF